MCELVHTVRQSTNPHKIRREFFMTHLNMHTFYVATLVTLGLLLGLMVVSSLRAGFLLTHM